MNFKIKNILLWSLLIAFVALDIEENTLIGDTYAMNVGVLFVSPPIDDFLIISNNFWSSDFNSLFLDNSTFEDNYWNGQPYP